MKLERIWKGILLLTLSVAPLVFNPLLVDVFGLGKQSLAGLGLVLSLLGFGVFFVVRKQDHLYWNKMLSWGILMIVAATLSWRGLESGARWRSLIYPWGLGSLVWVWMAWFLLAQAGEKTRQRLMLIWVWMGIGVSIFSLILFLLPNKIFPVYFPSKEMSLLTIGSGFSVFGNLIEEAVFLLVLFLFTTRGVYLKFREKREYLVVTLMGAVLLVGMVVGVYRSLRLPVPILDMATTWTIDMETIKRQPLFGLGVGNFVEGFYKYRGTGFNNSYWWGATFVAGISGILTWLAETGLLGASILVAGIVAVVRKSVKNKSSWLVLLVVLAPWSFSGLVLAGLVWMLLKAEEEKKLTLALGTGKDGGNVFPWLLMLAVIVFCGGASLAMFKNVASEYFWKKSLVAASKNDGNGTYTNQQKAIVMFGSNPDLRRNFSQTNLSLAQALLESNKQDMTPEIRQDVSTLLSQAVVEAKAAIALNGADPVSWVGIAGAYRGMVGLVDGSADWALQSYQQASGLDPSNPIILVEIGGIWYGSGNFEAADRMFEQAVNAKPTLANSWYNWAWTNYQLAQTNKQNVQYYGQKLNLAVNHMQQAVNLVGVDSGDYDKAIEELSKWKKELDELKAKVSKPPEEVKSTPETLKKPEMLPTPIVGKEEKVNVTKEQLEPPVFNPPETLNAEPTSTSGLGGP